MGASRQVCIDKKRWIILRERPNEWPNLNGAPVLGSIPRFPSLPTHPPAPGRTWTCVKLEFWTDPLTWWVNVTRTTHIHTRGRRARADGARTYAKVCVCVCLRARQSGVLRFLPGPILQKQIPQMYKGALPDFAKKLDSVQTERERDAAGNFQFSALDFFIAWNFCSFIWLYLTCLQTISFFA